MATDLGLLRPRLACPALLFRRCGKEGVRCLVLMAEQTDKTVISSFLARLEAESLEVFVLLSPAFSPAPGSACCCPVLLVSAVPLAVVAVSLQLVWCVFA